MKKFIEFLEKNNARENFERAFKNNHRDVKGYKNLCKKDSSVALTGAFDWACTREGVHYWSTLSDKWMQENTPLKQQLLSDD